MPRVAMVRTNVRKARKASSLTNSCIRATGVTADAATTEAKVITVGRRNQKVEFRLKKIEIRVTLLG